MMFKLKFRSWRVICKITKVLTLYGVNSHLADGKHVLMWDFDDLKLKDIVTELTRIQSAFGLPTIYVLSSGHEGHFLAYSFTRVNWLRAVSIVASTKGVDEDFLKYSVYRDHFTLRISAKEFATPHLVQTLPSVVQPESSIDDLVNFCRYDTIDD
jgi:hypothetical protein